MPRKKKEAPRRKDGLYEVKISIGKTPEGRLIRKSFYSNISKEDARRQAEKWKIQRAAAEIAGEPLPDSITLSSWADEWLVTYIKGKVKDSTYQNNFEIPIRLHIKPHFGKRKISDIRSVDIQEFLNKKSNDYSLDVVRKMRQCLWRLFESAKENGYCRYNPVTDNVKATSKKKKADKAAYTPEQVDLIIEYAKNHRLGLSIIVMLLTGISRSELLGLRWEDVTDDYTLHIRRGVTEAKNASTKKWEVVVDEALKNEFRKRSIPIPKFLYDMIMERPRVITLGGSKRNKTPIRKVETEYIFYGATGQVQRPSNWTNWVYKPFMRDMIAHYAEHDIIIPELTPHELRHTAATVWANSGISLYMISKLGGWSDLKMLSKVYGHPDIDLMRKELGYE